jgi:peptidoglycan hydrolase-like protein with peptidoglycan-binding domain
MHCLADYDAPDMPGHARTLPPLLGVLVLAWLAIATPVAAASPRFPNQSLGNRGVDVKAMQGFLMHHGAPIVVDGVFGPTTDAAVRVFQAANGLTVNGQADEATWSALLVQVQTGSTGAAVKALQRQLNEKRRAGLAVDGVFGASTRSALLAFQRHMGLTQNGIAGPLTWRYLIAHFERPTVGKVCMYRVNTVPAHWGTAAAIGQIEAAAVPVVAAGLGAIAIGDISLEHGGDIAGHRFHERGLEVDVRPMRRDRKQCWRGSSYRLASYDRRATRNLIRAIRAAAPGHIKLIYFNDPVLIREGLTRWYTGHDDHLHIRYCEKVHPVPLFAC